MFFMKKGKPCWYLRHIDSDFDLAASHLFGREMSSPKIWVDTSGDVVGHCCFDNGWIWGRISPVLHWTTLGSLVTVLGIGMVALPSGILASAF